MFKKIIVLTLMYNYSTQLNVYYLVVYNQDFSTLDMLRYYPTFQYSPL